MFKLLKKLIGTAQDRQIVRLKKIVDQVNHFDRIFQELDDSAIRSKTQEFKKRLQEGEALDGLLPEAYAVIKNVCRRLVGTQIHVSGYDQKWDMVPYDVQILGAIAMHKGYASEMETGEGKTLTAVLPLYLNALTGKPVHLVTTNDYLAKRDSEWVGTILRWLGLTCSALTNNTSPQERVEVYQSDVVYGTASEFGFDYLRDNSMSTRKEEQVQRGHYFAIVDEVDSILIDEARTPLIISGPVAKSRQLYHELKDAVAQIVKMQSQLTQRLASEAKAELEKSGFQLRSNQEQSKRTKEQEEHLQKALKKLWVVSKGTPRNKVLKRILEDPELRTQLDEQDLFYYGEQNASSRREVLSDLYTIIDEKASEYELTDLGIATWSKMTQEGSSDDFLMLDLGPLYAEIEHNSSYSSEEKMQKKLQLQEEDSKRKERAHNLRQLLRAHLLMEKDVDYIIQDDSIVIIDENTGRPQPGRRFSDGLHQAIEAKENVEIQKETQTYATVTLQNYFRLYDKLAGMTGTAMTEAGEFKEIYKIDVLAIPTHVSCVRKDAHDEIYMTEREKYNAILKEIKSIHDLGRPILIGTESVEISEKLSRILKVNKLPHTVLNARHHEQEAEIISQAGHKGAITIATNMAGRGTDIKLADGIASIGGLHVIGTTRHQSRRIDRQLRGRSARQGDPGSSKFFVSFEDQLMRLFASPKLNMLIKKWRPPEGEAISANILNRSIETAQKRIEQRNYTIRKYTLEYDDVINKQRQEIYNFRNTIMTTQKASEHLYDLLSNTTGLLVEEYLHQKTANGFWNVEGLIGALITLFPIGFDPSELTSLGKKFEDIDKHITTKIKTLITEKILHLKQKTKLFLSPDHDEDAPGAIVNEALQNLFIQKIDHHWQLHLLSLDHLRSEVSIRSVGNKDPLMEFKQESFKAFERMIYALNEDVLLGFFKLDVSGQPRPNHSLDELLQDLNFQTQQSFLPPSEPASQDIEEAVVEKVSPVVAGPRVGRNEICPCGSGKKHKKCCAKEED
ncbi:MAG: Protein translocase subunit SecA [Chlamydiae bacterium]|nr:Protein translocase subunit SecA [Chlamydiota bacterium]